MLLTARVAATYDQEREPPPHLISTGSTRAVLGANPETQNPRAHPRLLEAPGFQALNRGRRGLSPDAETGGKTELGRPGRQIPG